MPVLQFSVMEANLLLVLHTNSPYIFIMLKVTIPFPLQFSTSSSQLHAHETIVIQKSFLSFFCLSHLQLYIICSNGSTKEADIEVML
jgi:hypothetical protein